MATQHKYCSKTPTKRQLKEAHGMYPNHINTIYVLVATQGKHYWQQLMEEAQWMRMHHKYYRKRPTNWQLKVYSGEKPMDARTPQILQKNTYKRADGSGPWNALI